MASDRVPGRPGGSRASSGRVTAPKVQRTPPPSGRYTPPIPREARVGRPWVPYLMGAFLALGALVIILNYLEVLPWGTQNAYLLVGLVLITAGFITATQWR